MEFRVKLEVVLSDKDELDKLLGLLDEFSDPSILVIEGGNNPPTNPPESPRP